MSDPKAERARQDHLKRAAERLREIRGTYGDTSNDGDFVDKFRTPPAPEGWSYEWKTWTLLGKENPQYQVELARKGWTPVPLERHPEMMPRGFKSDHILIEGQMLMERPAVLTEEARLRDRREANLSVKSKEQQLGLAPKGQFDRMRNTGVRKSFEAMPIPQE